MNAFQNDSDARILTGSMKLAELLDLNYHLLGVLSRVGLHFGFGDDTVEEACRKHGVNPQTFLLICKVYTFNGYMPSADALRTADLRDILTYLRRWVAFQERFNEALPMIPVYSNYYYDFYTRRLQGYFRYEEEVVFPYVRNILDHAGSKDFTIYQYEENHTNVEEKISDLKNILMKYLPEECDDRQTSEILFKIYLLEMDLKKHTSIEDDILVPMVNRLEDHE